MFICDGSCRSAQKPTTAQWQQAGVVQQGLQLHAGQLIERGKSLGLCHALLDQQSVLTLKAGQNHQLLHAGSIPDVAFGVGVGASPFGRRHAKQGLVENIGL